MEAGGGEGASLSQGPRQTGQQGMADMCTVSVHIPLANEPPPLASN